MDKNESEHHHRWTECVSARWADDAGSVSWMLPDGGERRARPDPFGIISNGNYIKLSRTAGEAML